VTTGSGIARVSGISTTFNARFETFVDVGPGTFWASALLSYPYGIPNPGTADRECRDSEASKVGPGILDLSVAHAISLETSYRLSRFIA
jgi:hypothetical protein